MEFKRFSPIDVANANNIAILGKRSTGKTTLAKHLLRHLDRPHNIVFSFKDTRLEEYGDLVPHLIFDDCTEAEMKDLCSSAQDTVVVFDECIHEKEWHTYPSMQRPFKHILVLPFPMGMPLYVRCNLDYVFMFRETRPSTRRLLYERYATVIPSFSAFCEALDRITAEPYACMVIDNTAPSEKWEDHVNTFRIDAPV